MTSASIDGVVPRTRGMSAHGFYPDWWNRIGLNAEGNWANLDPDDAPIMQPDAPGGRSALIVATPWKNVTVTCTWLGDHSKGVGGVLAHAEGSESHGGLSFCREPDLFGGLWVLWAIGTFPDEIYVIAATSGPPHADGTPAVLGITTIGSQVICTVDGEEVLSEIVPHGPGNSLHYHGLVIDVNTVPGRPAGLSVFADDLSITPIHS